MFEAIDVAIERSTCYKISRHLAFLLLLPLQPPQHGLLKCWVKFSSKGFVVILKAFGVITHIIPHYQHCLLIFSLAITDSIHLSWRTFEAYPFNDCSSTGLRQSGSALIIQLVDNYQVLSTEVAHNNPIRYR